VVGTVGYMAPEQVRGLDVDRRADLFSLGLILYEMLSGRRAFDRATQADTMAAVLVQEPPDLADEVTAVPGIDRVVRRCLEKDPARRFESADAVAAALEAAMAGSDPGLPAAPAAARRPRSRPPLGTALIGGALLGAVAIGATFVFGPLPAADPPPGTKRIAVLPFENLGAGEDAYFAEGLADSVRGKLGSLPGLDVIARASSAPYRSFANDPAAIARELRVDYILTGRVRWRRTKGASRVEVRPELVAVDGTGASESAGSSPSRRPSRTSSRWNPRSQRRWPSRSASLSGRRTSGVFRSSPRTTWRPTTPSSRRRRGPPSAPARTTR